jgi:hypothetical protein
MLEKANGRHVYSPMTRLTKFDIAVQQLDDAITFYLENRNLVSAVTLAGAAEEILSKLCEERGKPSSLSHHAESAHKLHQHLMGLFPGVFQHDPGLKAFIRLRNETRNEFKHLMSGNAIQVDLQDKAGRLIAHAVKNYSTLVGYETEKMRQFQNERLKFGPTASAELEGVEHADV